jgi:hypothetical protein
MGLSAGRLAKALRNLCLGSAPEVAEDGQHAAVIVGDLGEIELAEQAPNMRLDSFRAHEQCLADPLIGSPLRHQLEDLALARRQLSEWVRATPSIHHLADYGAIDDALTGDHPAQRVDQVLDTTNVFLEKVSNAGRALFDQPHRVGWVEIL